MPHPGMIVARGNKFTGDIEQIDPEFITYVKELVPEICAPEKLVIKRINGQKVRARNFVQYFKDYLDIFNTMPPPDTLFEVNLFFFLHMKKTFFFNLIPNFLSIII